MKSTIGVTALISSILFLSGCGSGQQAGDSANANASVSSKASKDGSQTKTKGSSSEADMERNKLLPIVEKLSQDKSMTADQKKW